MRVIILFLVLFLPSCTLEYTEHFFSEHRETRVTERSELERRTSAIHTGKILVLPDERVRDQLIEYIDAAQSRIWIEIYTWTDTQLLDAVLRAKKRGIDVRVVLEGNVYGTPTINRKVADFLEKAEIPLSYADNYRYTFTHAKFFLIDDRYFIGTGNWTISSFSKNRDIIYVGEDTSHISFLEQLFQADFDHRAFLDSSLIPSGFVISPLQARGIIESSLHGARQRIVLFAQSVQDPAIIDILENKIHDGVSVQVCMANNQSNNDFIRTYTGSITWNIAKKPYLHAKVLFFDSGSVFVGSQNITPSALDHNREVGILISGNNQIFSQLFFLFEKDCSR